MEPLMAPWVYEELLSIKQKPKPLQSWLLRPMVKVVLMKLENICRITDILNLLNIFISEL
jgi:hypothetical protein